MHTAPAASAPVLNDTIIRQHSLSFDDFLIPGLVGLWLAGVLGLTGVVAAQWIRFYRKLAQASAPADENLQTLLDDCQREFGVSRKIELLETDAVQSPALFGLLRLRLLLPRGIGRQFAGRELRYIFLHEFAHVKRGDLWLNWLVTALQIMHWFNPLLWLGFARLRCRSRAGVRRTCAAARRGQGWHCLRRNRRQAARKFEPVGGHSGTGRHFGRQETDAPAYFHDCKFPQARPLVGAGGVFDCRSSGSGFDGRAIK